MQDRSPEPLEVIEALAKVVDALTDDRMNDQITLSLIRKRFIGVMIKRNWIFSSEYRHEATPLHAQVYALLGGTVSLNYEKWAQQRGVYARSEQAQE